MRRKGMLVLAALAAAALLALAVGDASARSFSFTERNFEYIWNNALTGKTKLTFGDVVGDRIECNATLLGRYSSSTIAKRTGFNQGTINHGATEGCGLTLRTETMPWGLRYRGFTGTLPTITTIAVGILGAQWKVTGEGCVYASEANEPLVLIQEGVSLESVRAEERNTIGLVEGFTCFFGSPIHFSGKGLILNLPRTANITVALI